MDTPETATVEVTQDNHLRDMANVGESLMEAIRDYNSHPFMKSWHPADCPSEIVGDLLNALDEATDRTRATRQDGLREALRADIINTPETADFIAGVPIEAAHQRERWGTSHDAGKTPFDWFWLVGYLAQKAASSAVAGDIEKAMHHTISTAAALANWHAALSGVHTEMRPGIGPGNGGDKEGSAHSLAAALSDSSTREESEADPLHDLARMAREKQAERERSNPAVYVDPNDPQFAVGSTVSPATNPENALPRLDDGLINAALQAHYGKTGLGIDGIDLTTNDRNWSFRDGFKRMWGGVRAELKRRAALSASPEGEGK